MKYCFIFFSFLTNVFGLDFIKHDLKVINIDGPSVYFSAGKRSGLSIKHEQIFYKGDILATGRNSTLVLESMSNGILILGPDTKIEILGHTEERKRVFLLIKGRIHVHKKPYTSYDSAGVILTLFESPYGFIGGDFNIELTEFKKEVYPINSEIEKVNMSEIKIIEDDEGQISEKNLAEYELEKEVFSKDKEKNLFTPPSKLSPKKASPFLRRSQTEFPSPFILNGRIRQSLINDIGPEFDGRLTWNIHREDKDYEFQVVTRAEWGNTEGKYEKIAKIFNHNDGDLAIFELYQAYFKIKMEDMEISLGKKPFRTGYSHIYDLTDIVTPKEQYDVFDDRRDIGLWEIGMNYKKEEWLIDLLSNAEINEITDSQNENEGLIQSLNFHFQIRTDREFFSTFFGTSFHSKMLGDTTYYPTHFKFGLSALLGKAQPFGEIIFKKDFVNNSESELNYLLGTRIYFTKDNLEAFFKKSLLDIEYSGENENNSLHLRLSLHLQSPLSFHNQYSLYMDTKTDAFTSGIKYKFSQSFSIQAYLILKEQQFDSIFGSFEYLF